MNTLRILSLPVDDGGCGWYRIRQPLAMVRNHTIHDSYIVDPETDDMEQVLKVIPNTHIATLRPGGELGMREFKKEKTFSNLKWVLDIDDNTELISPYSDHYGEYGVEEYYDNNLQKWLWKDGVANFDLKRNKGRVKNHIYGLREVDMVSVTTKRLAEYASIYNKNVAVLPNCIDFSKWWKIDTKPNKQLRVGWSGGISHYEDWYSIKEPLNRLLRQYQFKLVIAGNSFTGLIDKDLLHLVETHDWVPFKGHSYRMMCMNLDIAIIPLTDTPFNQYKSSVKWYEMSAMKVPSVVANVPPYSDEIENEKTAMGYNNADEFEKAVLSLLQNVNLRKKIGENAFNWVFKHRNAKSNVDLWVNAYKELVGF